MRFLVLLLALLSGPVFAQDYFGAIAYSPSSGAHGWANDMPSRQAAERAALSGCRTHAKDCRTVVWFKNACGALATGPKVYGWGWGATQALADAEAMKACTRHAKDCALKEQRCTTR